MLAKYTLTAGIWKKISTAGQSGSAWLKKYSGNEPTVLIAHTTEAQTYNPDDDPDLGVLDDNIPYDDAVGLDIDIAYELPIGEDLISAPLTADSVSDVFYATIKSGTCELIVDFG